MRVRSLHQPKPMKIPIYQRDEGKCPDGMYLALFHGRDTKKEDNDDRGYDGPLRYVHTTYDSNVKIGFAEGSDDQILRPFEVYGLKGADDILFRTKKGWTGLGEFSLHPNQEESIDQI